MARSIEADLAMLVEQRFLDRLIKESVDAEQILQDCGRIRLLRAAKAAIKVYIEVLHEAGLSAGRTEGGMRSL